MFNTYQDDCKKGHELWQEYVRYNGYSLKPSEYGLKALSKYIGVDVEILKRLIGTYLV